jgi:hypothetical protein
MNMTYCLRAFLSSFLSISVGILFSTAVLAAEKKSAIHKEIQPAPSSPTPTRVLSSSPVVRGAANAGVRTCLERIDQVTSFVASNADTGAFLFPAPSNPDKQVFSIAMELLAPEMVAYASESFAPSGSNACSATYEAISYWPMNCQQTAAKQFASLKPVGVIKRAIQILDGGPAMRVFLMPADQGCIAIKKEMIFY